MPQDRSVLHTLRQFTDEQVLALLQARPDLATPPPGSLAGLAARALTRPSLERAVAGLNTFELQVLEAAAICNHSLPAAAVSAAAIRRALGGKVGAAAVRSVIALLQARLLILGGSRNLRVPTEIFEVLGRYPAGLGPSLQETLAQRADLTESQRELWTASLTSAAQVTALVERAPKKARRVLELLTWGPPVGDRGAGAGTAGEGGSSAGTEAGRAADTEAGASASPITWLISHGLLATAGDSHVVLPREVALILRGGRTHKDVSATAPQLETAPPTGYRPALGSAQEFADASSGERITEVLQLVELLLQLWAAGGPTLRTGGIGVRELRRVAGELELPESEAAFLIELMASAQLLAPREGDDHWVPSREELMWQQQTPAEQWVQLAWAWLKSPRATWLIGHREQGQIVAPLQRGIDRAWVPQLRHRTLEVLAGTERGAVPNRSDIYTQLKWHSPRSAPHERAVYAFLDHAQWLGILGAGALTTAGRHLLAAADATDLAQEDAAIAEAVTATQAALPAEVDEVLVQGDLSIIVPGRPAQNLQWLWQVAQVEQRGAAQVLRLTEESVRAALESGWTAAGIGEKLATVTRTDVPQPVEYLLRDVERQIGQVRAYRAQSVITTADAARASEILADASLQELGFEQAGPTVLISPAPLSEVLATLRASGYAPLAEQVAQDAARAARRRPSARGALRVGQPVSITLDDAAPHRALMAIRAGEKQESTGAPDPLIARQRLTALHTAGRTGWITLVDGGGKTQRRLVRVVGLSQGRARLHDVERESELVVQLHRIVAVDP